MDLFRLIIHKYEDQILDLTLNMVLLYNVEQHNAYRFINPKYFELKISLYLDIMLKA